jgi:hypothetical protein
MQKQGDGGVMAGNKQKKDGGRKEHATRARKRDFEQPIVGSVTKQQGLATSNFTDGDIAGGDHKHDAEGHLKRKPPVSEPRRRTSKNPE